MRINKKSLVMFAIALVAIAVSFTACEKDVKVTGVSVDPTTLTVEIGKTAPIKATVKPTDADDKTVTWKSSDLAIATVTNGGVVTGVSTGVATISCTTNDGKFQAATKVTVIDGSINYAPMVIGSYTGEITLGEDVVTDAAVIDILENKTNVVIMKMNQTLNFGGMEIPINIACDANVTLVDGAYKINATTTWQGAPVVVDGLFDGTGNATINININLAGSSIDVVFTGKMAIEN